MTIQHRPPPGKYRLTIDDFMRLDKADVFGTGRTELLDGNIIIMNAEYRPHAWIAGELGYRLRRVLEDLDSGLYVMSASVALPPHDMPLPDIVVTSEPRGDGAIPLASVKLIVEVAASTLGRDLGDKAIAYARAGIPEYWVVDVERRVVRQMWRPAGAAFGRRRDVALGGELFAETMPALSINTEGL